LRVRSTASGSPYTSTSGTPNSRKFKALDI
jgi:hypothetical protein